MSDNGSSWLCSGYGIRCCDCWFIHPARLNLLPTNQTRGKWYNMSKHCRRCHRDIETLPHAVCHCLPCMVSIRRRHTLVVNGIHNAIRTGEVTLDKHVSRDLPRIRPDIIHYDGDKAMDVSIPFDMVRMLYPWLLKPKYRIPKHKAGPTGQRFHRRGYPTLYSRCSGHLVPAKWNGAQ